MTIFDEKKEAMTYRCDPDMARHIKAMKVKTNKSFQAMTDEMWTTLLFKCRTEGEYFNDLPFAKKVEYTIKDIFDSPSFNRFFNKKT